LRLPRLFLALTALLAAWALSATAGGISLTQADGTLLELPAPAGRIITLSPHLAEGVYAAGAGPLLVATVEYSEYPQAAADLPRVGDAFRLDIERIVALQPDLVIAWDTGNPRAAVDRLRELGLPVWSVEIRDPAAIAAFVAAVGNATGRDASAESERLLGLLAALEARYTAAPPLRYFYQVDPKPLFTINGEHLISRGLALCGGVNVFAAEPALAFQVSRESVILADPDALIAPQPEMQPDPLQSWRDWNSLRAVRNQALVLLPADEFSRATPRFIEALAPACEELEGVRSRTAATASR